MECVLLKMGVDAAEFTKSSGTGRIHLYTGNGANAGNNTPAESALMDTVGTTKGTFNNYDQIILPCWGDDPTSRNTANRKDTTELANLIAYADAGGHFFATHFSYTWLTQPWNNTNNGEFVSAANWDVDSNTSIASTNGTVDSERSADDPGHEPWHVRALAQQDPGAERLHGEPHAAPQPGHGHALPRCAYDVDTVAGKSVDWIDGTDPNSNAAMLLHFTFDTPVNAASGQCGHAIYSDFHVTNQNDTSTYNFTSANDRATECGTAPMTAQEKILEYMIWDLASCVPGTPSSPCVKKTCSSFPGTCGVQGDGCGGLTNNCGGCGTGLTCGGGGVSNVCGAPDGGPCTLT